MTQGVWPAALPQRLPAIPPGHRPSVVHHRRCRSDSGDGRAGSWSGARISALLEQVGVCAVVGFASVEVMGLKPYMVTHLRVGNHIIKPRLF